MIKWKSIQGLAVGAVFVLLVVQGCKVGHRYSRPDLDLPEKYRGDVIDSTADTAGMAHVHWGDFFQDSILKDLIDTALQNNNDVKTALLNLQIANRQLLQNKANYLPSVDMDIATVNKQWRSRDFGSNPASRWYDRKQTDAPDDWFTYVSQFGTQLNFSWELDIWGKISNRKDQLLAEYLDTDEARKAIQTNLIAQVAKGYFNLLILDAKIEVAKRNVMLNDSTIRMIKLQYDAGEITALAIQQTESQRLLAASLVPELEKEIILQENALRILSGKLPDAVNRSRDVEHIFGTTGEPPISLGAPLDILRNRPDIRSAEFQLIAANAKVNIQQTMRYPSLSLGGALGVNSMLPQNWFNIPGALLGNVSAGLTAPIFRNKTLRTQYEVAKLERDKAEISLQKQVLEAVNEVSNAIVTVDKQREQLALAQQRVDNAQLAVRNANLLFRSGYATYLEVITAQGNALNSDLALVELKREQLEAFVDLYRALGGGWE
ncbi:efflux transporter outer membrane subunit [Parapedobacter sp. SGR-10]|uniref:efflux transporter outer membrane subunit n=1 Tax=Parapedobacter sp. SGR-10 TaxID=2710879 RepID=UPI0013D805C2|nr:efflux transporter outer membrane subunit [Parapedobacter sp. SGR-10]NGF57214.1 efflux transporter outer membrane subunit [Parapedobacter sp. SGR-10]